MITETQWIEFLIVVKSYAKDYYNFKISEKEILNEMLKRTLIAQCICDSKKGDIT